jgi:hypothetical protein
MEKDPGQSEELHVPWNERRLSGQLVRSKEDEYTAPKNDTKTAGEIQYSLSRA